MHRSDNLKVAPTTTRRRTTTTPTITRSGLRLWRSSVSPLCLQPDHCLKSPEHWRSFHLVSVAGQRWRAMSSASVPKSSRASFRPCSTAWTSKRPSPWWPPAATAATAAARPPPDFSIPWPPPPAPSGTSTLWRGWAAAWSPPLFCTRWTSSRFASQWTTARWEGGHTTPGWGALSETYSGRRGPEGSTRGSHPTWPGRERRGGCTFSCKKANTLTENPDLCVS